MEKLWSHVERMGHDHGVDPILFAVLYIAHHPLFWGTMAWLAVRVRRKQPVVFQIVLGAFFWLMPYLYILVFGHGLPRWVYVAAVIGLVVGGRHAVMHIRERLAASRAEAAAIPPPAGL